MSLPQPSTFPDLDGQVAFVTGASGGLGYRFAQTLAGAGASVAVVGRRLERLESLAEDIRASGGKALPIVLDVRDTKAVPAAIDQAERHFGRVSILINNAGVPDAQYATKMSIDLIDDVINTNFRAPFVIACEVARRLIAAKQPGRIVNISSVGAYHYGPTTCATLYCAAKAGLSRLTETLAMEWAGFGINVNAIAPGLFRSAMSEAQLARVGEKLLSGAPRKRMGEPHQLDSTLLYLVSPASECVTGICLRIDDAQFPR